MWVLHQIVVEAIVEIGVLVEGVVCLVIGRALQGIKILQRFEMQMKVIQLLLLDTRRSDREAMILYTHVHIFR